MPTETVGTLYSAPFALSSSATVKAIGYKSQWVDSAVSSTNYIITGTVAVPVLSPVPGTYTTGQTIGMSSATNGSTIRFTTDGSTPSETAGTVYTSPITAGVSQTVKAIAYEANWITSAVTSGVYTITGTVASPIMSPSGGTYTLGQSVTMSTTTSGASIRYTVDGSAPSSTVGTLYTGAVAVGTDTTIKAIAYLSGWADSAIATQTYTITGTVATPAFNPASGIFTSVQTITLSTATPGATIRYTTDGTAPSSTNGAIYSAGIAVSTETTIKAMAYKSAWADSAIASSTFYFTAPSGGAALGTPPADSSNGLDPRGIGVRTFGAYWGAAGEQIDTTAGNLNFTVPMLNVMSRGGWSVPFSLSYNSQMWRQDSGGTWALGQDVGYGLGWRLQAGSLVPIWSGISQIDHYLFTDATGAE